jgi:8-oxo-dGTP diphosphatase
MGDPRLVYDKQAISVDCVVFGFDGTTMHVLLVKRKRTLSTGENVIDQKLPGSLISDKEDLPHAAARVTQELIGALPIKLRQMEIFSDPKRVQGEALKWINDYYKVAITRVVTMVFFAVIKLDRRLKNYVLRKGASWVELNEVRHLALDHNQILITAIDYLMRLFRQEPVAFDFLPRKFTIKQLQNLYEAVFDTALDNRNFRRKMLPQYIVPTGEIEDSVTHRPAQYFYFDSKKYHGHHPRNRNPVIVVDPLQRLALYPFRIGKNFHLPQVDWQRPGEFLRNTRCCTGQVLFVGDQTARQLLVCDGFSRRQGAFPLYEQYMHGCSVKTKNYTINGNGLFIIY